VPAPLNAAIVGCGAIAHEHVRFLTSSPRVGFAAAVDRSAALARYFMERYGAGAAFCDLGEMLRSVKVDVVHVLSPPGTHEGLVQSALEAGAHVICEKPMAGDLAGTEKLLQFAAARDRHLIESANTMWNENVVALRRLVEAGEIGEVREVEIALALDLASGPFGDLNLGERGVPLAGGAVHDFLPHICGAFLYLSGQDRIAGVAGRLENRSGNPRVGYDTLDCLVDAGEVRGRISLSPEVAPASFRLAVRGTRASAETELFNPYLRVTGGPNVGKRAPVELLRTGMGMVRASVLGFRNKIIQHTPYHGLDRMLDEIYAALQEGRAPPVTPAKIRATAAMVDQVVALRT
jgi:predicted dehydrogenase